MLICLGVPQNLSEWVVGACKLSPLASHVCGGDALAAVRHLHRDRLPGILVLVPILAPLAHALGINDLQFGIVVIVSLTMGMITPRLVGCFSSPPSWPRCRCPG